MSDEIESAVFSTAEGAGWTGLGQPIPAEIAKDPRAIAKMVGADYTIAKMVAGFRVPGDGIPKWMEAANRVALVRSDTGEFLEFASANKYHVQYRQPVDVFEAFRDELASEGMEISHAAVLRGGRLIAVCARLLGADIVVGKSDKILTYVTGSTGYDASHGTNFFLTGIRTVCANTLAYGLADAEKGKRLIHASAAQRFTKSDALKDLLADAQSTVQAESDLYGRLAAVKLSDEEAARYFMELLDVNPAFMATLNADGRPVISTRTKNQLQALGVAFKRAQGSWLETADGTLFGAVNAVSFIADHEAQIRDTNQDGERVARMTSATFGNGAQVKARAMRLAVKRLETIAA